MSVVNERTYEVVTEAIIEEIIEETYEEITEEVDEEVNERSCEHAQLSFHFPVTLTFKSIGIWLCVRESTTVESSLRAKVSLITFR